MAQTIGSPGEATTAAEPDRSSDRVLSMYRTMCLIREFEEAVIRSGGGHPSIGQEAVPVGVCSNLQTADLIFSNHRGHGHAIAKGARVDAMMKELLGRAGGTSNGKGGSMHIADFSVGMLGANGIVADGVPLAVGAAQAVSIRGDGRVVAVFVGDGAINRGPFLEGLNWAALFELPLLFVCEDNGYASSTVSRVMTAGDGVAARARAFGIPAETIDGNDLFAVDETARTMIGRIRDGGGPQFLHAVTYRLMGHTAYDLLKYRPSGESDERWKNEPIARTEEWLLANGALSGELASVRDDAKAIIEAAWESAIAAPEPDPSEAFTDVQDFGGPLDA
jgi:TPP-dependent pyruvate/acetoin dehydrogenase alpha subunit